MTGRYFAGKIPAREHKALLLAEIATERDTRQFTVRGPEGKPELGWVTYERNVMRDAVNAERASAGLPPAGLAEILRIERSAIGHCDYVDKFALGCAFLVEGEQR